VFVYQTCGHKKLCSMQIVFLFLVFLNLFWNILHLISKKNACKKRKQKIKWANNDCVVYHELFCYQNFLQFYMTTKWDILKLRHKRWSPFPRSNPQLFCALLTFYPRDSGLHCTPSHPSSISLTLLFCSVVTTCMPANFLSKTSLSEEMLHVITKIMIY